MTKPSRMPCGVTPLNSSEQQHVFFFSFRQSLATLAESELVQLRAIAKDIAAAMADPLSAAARRLRALI